MKVVMLCSLSDLPWVITFVLLFLSETLMDSSFVPSSPHSFAWDCGTLLYTHPSFKESLGCDRSPRVLSSLLFRQLGFARWHAPPY